MLEVKLSLTANSGVCINVPGGRICVDAFSKSKNEFSIVTPEIFEYAKKSPDFQNPDVICFTHTHEDHYSYKMAGEPHNLWPNSKMILPDFDFDDQIVLAGDEVDYNFNDISMRFIKTTHSGKGFDKVPHYSVVIKTQETAILFSGDITGPSEQLKQIIEEEKISLYILPFTWSTVPASRSFLRDVAKAEHVALVHIPFLEDDTFGYRRALENTLPALQDLTDVKAFDKAYQTEVFQL